MPYVLDNPDRYENLKVINSKGETQCVEFIRQATGAPQTAQWVEGKKVQGDLTLTKGTAIATFVNGKYPQTGSTGKHAAIYLSQDSSGIWVLDQWAKLGHIGKRHIPFKPSSPGLSNDGTAFSVIEKPGAAPAAKVSAEELIPCPSLEDARNGAIQWLEDFGVRFDGNRQIMIGRLERSPLFGKEIGVGSPSGARPFWALRLDYDPAKGLHYNVQFGESKKACKKAAFKFPGSLDLIDRLARQRDPR